VTAGSAAAGEQGECEREADALVAALRGAGVELAFGLPGVHNLAIWDAAARGGLPLVTVRHEQTAVYAADGAARVIRRLGVAVTTTGPGAANALGATGEAWASGSPVVVIATDIPSTLRLPGAYRGVLHETRDQAAMFAPVTKATLVATAAADVGPLVRQACDLALAAPSGPVYVQIPTDFLAATVAPTASDRRLPPRGVDAPNPAAAAPRGEAVTAAASLLRRARRPLVWAGGGAVRAEAGDEVAALSELLGAPVIETYAGRGLLPLDHPGKLTVTPHDPEVGPLWDEADAVLAIGTDFDGMMTQNWLLPQPPALVSIALDAADAGRAYHPDVVLAGDAREGAAALRAELEREPPEPSGERFAAAAARQGRAREALTRTDPGAVAFLEALAWVPATAPIFADMCVAGYWTAAYHPLGRPRRLGYPVGWGTLGFAFPAAAGAAIHDREPVLCVCGDGGFAFAAGELATVAQEAAPLTTLVVDDGGYGMLRYDQRAAGREPLGTELLTPDLVALGRAFGVESRLVPGVDALGPALAEALAAGEPRLLVLKASLRPPPSTSPRWYRRGAATDRAETEEDR
jgi:acetolactate synthase-1/2/3 large subunit